MNPPKPHTFWNGWRMADLLVIASLLVAAGALKARIDEDHAQLLRLLAGEEALAAQVGNHMTGDEGRDRELKARMDALEREIQRIGGHDR